MQGAITPIVIMLSVIIRNAHSGTLISLNLEPVIILSVVMPSVIIQNVVAPSKNKKQSSNKVRNS